MTRQSRRASNREWPIGQVTAVKIATLECQAVERLTTPLRSLTAEETEKITSGFYVETATKRKPETMWLKNRRSLKPKEQWDRLSECKANGRNDTTR
jgi:hypothetical protein